MNEQIQVELHDGGTCRMSPAALDYFLTLNTISRFMRANGWVDVCRDSLRTMKIRSRYRGRERRCPRETYRWAGNPVTS